MQRKIQHMMLWAVLCGMLGFALGCGVEEPSTPTPIQLPAAPTENPLQRISEGNRFRLVAPQDFVLGTPADGQITAAEAKQRYADFCTVLTGVAETPTVTARFYEDCSGAREDYWLLQNAATGSLDLAISADTGQVLGCRGMARCDMILPPSGRLLQDWQAEDYDYVCLVQQEALGKLSHADVIPEVYFSSMLNDAFISLAAVYADGREATFNFRINVDAAWLQSVEVTCQGEVDRWTAPWIADVLFVDPSNGSVQETWLSGRGVTELFP